MLEVLGATALDEIVGLGAIGIADVIQPELILAEAMVIAGVFIYRAIKKHKQEKDSKPDQPSQDDDEEPVAPENLDDEIIEENAQVDE
jgi:hypothetical protein